MTFSSSPIRQNENGLSKDATAERRSKDRRTTTRPRRRMSRAKTSQRHRTEWVPGSVCAGVDVQCRFEGESWGCLHQQVIGASPLRPRTGSENSPCWTGFTQFTLLEEKSPDGYMSSGVKLTR